MAGRYQGNGAVEGATLIGTVPFGQGSLLMQPTEAGSWGRKQNATGLG